MQQTHIASANVCILITPAWSVRLMCWCEWKLCKWVAPVSQVFACVKCLVSHLPSVELILSVIQHSTQLLYTCVKISSKLIPPRILSHPRSLRWKCVPCWARLQLKRVNSFTLRARTQVHSFTLARNKWQMQVNRANNCNSQSTATDVPTGCTMAKCTAG